jgi:CheY-like chemotaxis protein
MLLASSLRRNESAPRFKVPRVLVVDDVALCRKLHVKVASKYCVEVLEACNGLEAVTMVLLSIKTNTPFSAILLDNSMPFLDGADAAKLMREAGYQGKIFGITGNSLPADIESFKLKGADDVLIKPVNKQAFKDLFSILI